MKEVTGRAGASFIENRKMEKELNIVANKQEVSMVKTGAWEAFAQRLQDYKLLVKLRLSLTVVFSSVLAYLIAQSGPIQFWPLFVLALGGFLVTSAANVLNQVLEKDYDRLMRRTADRPLPAGRMTSSNAVLLSGFMSLAGITLLALFNPWTAFLGMLAMVTYAFLYTPLKRVSPAAIAVGAIPGALPTMIGVVAAEGQMSYLALALFGLQFFWQFPHFMSIGWLAYEDYQHAGYKLLPAADESQKRNLGFQSMVYAGFLLLLSWSPYWLGTCGILSAFFVTALSAGYLFFAWRFYRHNDRRTALQLMFYSFLYIPAALLTYLIDKI